MKGSSKKVAVHHARHVFFQLSQFHFIVTPYSRTFLIFRMFFHNSAGGLQAPEKEPSNEKTDFRTLLQASVFLSKLLPTRSEDNHLQISDQTMYVHPGIRNNYTCLPFRNGFFIKLDGSVFLVSASPENLQENDDFESLWGLSMATSLNNSPPPSRICVVKLIKSSENIGVSTFSLVHEEPHLCVFFPLFFSIFLSLITL